MGPSLIRPVQAFLLSLIVLLFGEMFAGGGTALAHGNHQHTKGAPAPVLVLQGEFVVHELGGRPLPQSASQRRPSLIFQDPDGLTGYLGCNQVSAHVVRGRGEEARFGQIVTTKMACAGPGFARERQMLVALQGTRKITKFGPEIRLLSASGRVLARLSAIGPRGETGPGLYGKTWTLIRLNGRSLDSATERPQIRFEAGQINGSTGCNSFSGRHERIGGVSRFLNLIQTERACVATLGDPMALEAEFVRALSQSDQIILEGGHLTIKASGGSETLVFEAGR
ncbi:hypothetical protein PbB2_01283 [Candidatus Phycosocius bacilliformis]|uniref:DUF306 domain-containing protein n=1 Tax=Candidatus Phycosocius bacilliformis TaxID=1445552 RepID=A0A2P2E984_9PROT|nr:META domain-containing protein [Candidatus Phycosocius bacilliformis]GBF57615.1 hypothetical protein PbB2_01283 [Candidatus Phycosocius bacilliformis]